MLYDKVVFFPQARIVTHRRCPNCGNIIPQPEFFIVDDFPCGKCGVTWLSKFIALIMVRKAPRVTTK